MSPSETFLVGTVTAQISCLVLAAVLFAYSFNRTIQSQLGIGISLLLAAALLIESGITQGTFGEGFPISLIMLFGCGTVIWFRLVFLSGVRVQGYRVLPQEFGVLGVMLAGYYAAIYFDPTGNQDALLSFQLMWLGIIIVADGLVLYIAFFALGRDLEEARHQIRLSFLLPLAAIAAAANVVTVLSLFALPGLSPQQYLEIGVTVSLLFIVLLVAWGLAPQRGAVFGVAAEEDAETAVTQEALNQPASQPVLEPDAGPMLESDAGLESGDQVVLNRLALVMKNEEFFKEQGLTIDQLSRRLAVPSYVLRRVINKGLGFRNFSSFLNHFRISAACEELGNPELSHKQIIGIAMDVGYQSLGPFNRAFREAEGMTPSDYRKKALGSHPDFASPMPLTDDQRIQN